MSRPFSERAVVGCWVMASLLSSAIPFFLMLLYHHVPWAKEILDIGQDKNVYIPILGWVGYRLRGQALWFGLATAVTYGSVGVLMCVRSAGLSYNKGIRTLFSEHLFLLAVGAMLFVVPLLSVSWAIALDRNAIPLGPWGEYDGNHGPWYRVYDLRYLLDLTFDIPLLGLISATASFFVRFSTHALLACAGNGAVFFLVIYTHYWLVD